MTTLHVGWEPGGIRQFSVSGHAGFASHGQDIVCAAASILITTCINALATVAGVVPTVKRVTEEPIISLTLPADMGGKAADTAQIILRTGLQGFKDLAMAYPKHFTIINGRETSC